MFLIIVLYFGYKLSLLRASFLINHYILSQTQIILLCQFVACISAANDTNNNVQLLQPQRKKL